MALPILAPAPRQTRAPVIFVVLVACAAILAGGAVTALVRTHQPLAVTPPTTVSDADRAVCATVSDRLPATVAAAEQRGTRPTSGLVAAWGNPAIVLRCGVRAPGPTTLPCQRIEGVDWLLVRDTGGGALLQTFDRAPTIELQVPDGYARELVVADVAPALASLGHTGTGCSALANDSATSEDSANPEHSASPGDSATLGS